MKKLTKFAQWQKSVVLKNGKKLTSPLLAKIVGVDRVSIENWKSGKNTPIGRNLKRLEKYFEVDFENMFFEKEEVIQIKKIKRGKN